MCGCEASFVCSRCRGTTFAAEVANSEPLSIAEWNDLLVSEQMVTAEPFAPEPFIRSAL